MSGNKKSEDPIAKAIAKLDYIYEVAVKVDAMLYFASKVWERSEEERKNKRGEGNDQSKTCDNQSGNS